MEPDIFKNIGPTLQYKSFFNVFERSFLYSPPRLDLFHRKYSSIIFNVTWSFRNHNNLLL